MNIFAILYLLFVVVMTGLMIALAILSLKEYRMYADIYKEARKQKNGIYIGMRGGKE